MEVQAAMITTIDLPCTNEEGPASGKPHLALWLHCSVLISGTPQMKESVPENLIVSKLNRDLLPNSVNTPSKRLTPQGRS